MRTPQATCDAESNQDSTQWPPEQRVSKRPVDQCSAGSGYWLKREEKIKENIGEQPSDKPYPEAHHPPYEESTLLKVASSHMKEGPMPEEPTSAPCTQKHQEEDPGCRRPPPQIFFQKLGYDLYREYSDNGPDGADECREQALANAVQLLQDQECSHDSHSRQQPGDLKDRLASLGFLVKLWDEIG